MAKLSLYARVVSERFCRASCRDVEGVEHSVEVSAGSLYEAVALVFVRCWRILGLG